MIESGHLRAGCASHVGRIRTHNEDALFVLTTDQLGQLASEHPFGLFILADGMGGHKSGEVASLMAVRVAAQHLAADILIPYLGGQEPSAGYKTIVDALRDAAAAADQAVRSRVVGGGTTLTCALVMGDNVYLAHVGDSRAYIFDNGVLRQITRDHSLVDRLIEIGQISLDEALYHPQRNVLYRAVGQGDGLEVDTHVEPMPPGSQILLCSDGLWGMVSHEQMVSILSSSASLQQACETLIETANRAGGKDNITVALIAKE